MAKVIIALFWSVRLCVVRLTRNSSRAHSSCALVCVVDVLKYLTLFPPLAHSTCAFAGAVSTLRQSIIDRRAGVLPGVKYSSLIASHCAGVTLGRTVDAPILVLWVFAGVHKKHQTHNHKRPSRGNKCLGNLCREKGVAWYNKKEVTVWGTKTHQNKGTRESVTLDDALDRTWLTWLQQETTTRRVREDQVYPVTQETQERGNARTT